MRGTWHWVEYRYDDRDDDERRAHPRPGYPGYEAYRARQRAASRNATPGPSGSGRRSASPYDRSASPDRSASRPRFASPSPTTAHAAQILTALAGAAAQPADNPASVDEVEDSLRELSEEEASGESEYWSCDEGSDAVEEPKEEEGEEEVKEESSEEESSESGEEEEEEEGESSEEESSEEEEEEEEDKEENDEDEDGSGSEGSSGDAASGRSYRSGAPEPAPYSPSWQPPSPSPAPSGSLKRERVDEEDDGASPHAKRLRIANPVAREEEPLTLESEPIGYAPAATVTLRTFDAEVESWEEEAQARGDAASDLWIRSRMHDVAEIEFEEREQWVTERLNAGRPINLAGFRADFEARHPERRRFDTARDEHAYAVDVLLRLSAGRDAAHEHIERLNRLALVAVRHEPGSLDWIRVRDDRAQAARRALIAAVEAINSYPRSRW